jgi:Fe-S-cluster containining protein
METTFFIYALIRFLNEKWLYKIKELDERKRQVAERLVKKLIAHNENGYCVHPDRNTFKCTIRESRTVPCRGFDCRNNKRWHICEDYEKKILNPELMERIDIVNNKIYSSCLSSKSK